VQRDNSLINACRPFNKNAILFNRLFPFRHYVIWLLEKAKFPSDILRQAIEPVARHDTTIKCEPFALLSSLSLGRGLSERHPQSRQLSLGRLGELVTQTHRSCADPNCQNISDLFTLQFVISLSCHELVTSQLCCHYNKKQCYRHLRFFVIISSPSLVRPVSCDRSGLSWLLPVRDFRYSASTT